MASCSGRVSKALNLDLVRIACWSAKLNYKTILIGSQCLAAKERDNQHYLHVRQASKRVAQESHLLGQ
eukprot:2262374-Amphidinium_carterae.1